MNQVYWTVHTKANGDFVVDANLGGPHQIRRGDRATFTFDVPDFSDDKSFSSNHTVPEGVVETYNDVTIDNGVTVTVDGVLQAASITVNGTLDVTSTGTAIATEADYTTIREFREWAGSKAQQTVLDGTVKVKSQIPSDVGISSLVVGIEPSGDLQGFDVDGVWAILDRVDDERVPALTNGEYRFESTVLATYSEYRNHADLESDLQL